MLRNGFDPPRPGDIGLAGRGRLIPLGQLPRKSVVNALGRRESVGAVILSEKPFMSPP